MDAGSCGGVCDAMYHCGGGGAAKNIAPLSGGLLLTLERELVGAESGFPSHPVLVCAWETIPVEALFRKTAGSEEGAGGYGRQPFIIDWKRRPDRFLLRLLTYSGTHGSSAHQTRVAERRETMYVALRLPLPPLRRAKKSRRGTLL